MEGKKTSNNKHRTITKQGHKVMNDAKQKKIINVILMNKKFFFQNAKIPNHLVQATEILAAAIICGP